MSNPNSTVRIRNLGIVDHQAHPEGFPPTYLVNCALEVDTFEEALVLVQQLSTLRRKEVVSTSMRDLVAGGAAAAPPVPVMAAEHRTLVSPTAQAPQVVAPVQPVAAPALVAPQAAAAPVHQAPAPAAPAVAPAQAAPAITIDPDAIGNFGDILRTLIRAGARTPEAACAILDPLYAGSTFLKRINQNELLGKLRFGYGKLVRQEPEFAPLVDLPSQEEMQAQLAATQAVLSQT